MVLLEKGGYYDAEDMNQREVDMMPLLWKNGGANFTDNLRIAIAQGQCLGGSTVINDAVCFKTPQIVINQWRDLGVNIPDIKWKNALDEVWGQINVEEVKDDELNRNNMMLKKACELRGYKASKNHRNCNDCMRCGFCHLGCHYETKQDMLRTYIREAMRTTDIRIYCNCEAERITNENGMADGVDGNFIGSKGGKSYKIRVNAKVVIVAAGSIASSQILMKSKIGNGNVGQGLSLHPAPFLLGRFRDEINAYDGIPMAFTCHEFGVTNGIDEGGFLIESIFVPMFQFSLAVPSFLKEHAELMKDLTHYSMAGAMIRDEPNGTITLTANGNPRVQYSSSKKDILNIAKGLETLANLWFDVGAEELIAGHRKITRLRTREDIPKLVDAIKSDPDGLLVASAHPQGGNRMGDDPTNCVVDSNWKVHGFKNLFVCDASVFPTALGVNPQVTVMALASMAADHINEIWDPSFSALRPAVKLGETCSITQPMYCSEDSLESMFNQSGNAFPIETLENAGENSANRWSFNKDTLEIYNNKYWKGFFPTDPRFIPVYYLGGFWKRFVREGGQLKGITHPFEMPVEAPNIPEVKKFAGFGDVIHLRYTSPEFSLFYDLLKIVSKDTILGKAFVGIPPYGRLLFTFSMSRKYNVDFMTEEDHASIYQNYSRAPDRDEVIGRWKGKLVSDSAVTPDTQVFDYREDQSGKLEMGYIFGGLLRGTSRVTLTPEQMNMYDFTSWHDEVKIVTNDFMVGKWCSPWTRIPLTFGPSFLSVEKGQDGTRYCLRFFLRRTS
ncbi:MAG: GMC family oxidoreductase [Nitrososphaerales archaeon]